MRLSFLLLATISAAWATEKPVGTVDVCQLFLHPEQYANRMVKVKGYVLADFEELTLSSPTCPYLKLWLTYADDSEALQRHGDTTDAPLKISVKRDGHFKTFEKQIRINKCASADIQAVLVGRIDHLAKTMTHDGGGTQIVGFGKDGFYSTRLIVSSVLESSFIPCDESPRQR